MISLNMRATAVAAKNSQVWLLKLAFHSSSEICRNDRRPTLGMNAKKQAFVRLVELIRALISKKLILNL
ncbi:hypothetical protein [Tardiphaga sp. vice278]|uniref:hypothetical protein n=1 Tax=Tardiphaga sp. vice278 TaxID=2592815 RepID=UPI0011627016|nr:hypothetical protein [Tardiphaga sp. vice278]QDM15475.1 hypothetical protein FNL53_05615 [Tardiphaga sp. vice278]